MEDELTLPLPPPKKKTLQPTEDVLLLPPPPPKKVVAKPAAKGSKGVVDTLKDIYSNLKESFSTPATPEQKTEAEDRAFDFVPEHYKNAINRGLNLASQAEIINPYGTKTEEIGKVAELQKQTEALPSSKEYQEFSNAPSFSDAASVLAKHPLKVLGELTLESLSSLGSYGASRMAAGAATGAALGSVIPGVGTAAGVGTGTVVGMADTSLALEYASSIMDSFQQAGVDVTDPKALEEAFNNQALVGEARSHAYKKAVPIALFDLVSGGIAGKLSSKPSRTIIGNLAKSAGEFGVQAALGAAGETAGELTSGEKIQPGAILGEAIGELGTTPVEVASGILSRSKPSNKEIKIDQVINQTADTGNPAINAQIDEGAKLSPEEEKQLKQKQDEQAKTGERKTLQGTEKQNSEGAGSTESGSSSSVNRTEEIRSEENGVLGQKREEVNAIQEPSPSSEVPLPGEGGENIAQSSEGIRPGIEGQETAQKSKAYQEALDKVTALQDKFTKLPIEANADELMFDLREARRALAAIANTEKPNVRTNLQKTIENSINPKQQPVTVNNPATALKQQIKQHYQNIKEGVVKGASAVNDLIQKVKDVATEHKLTSAQTTSLLGKVQHSNLFTPGSISKLNAFVDKVAENADYAEKLQQAKTLRKTITKKGKSTARDFRERNLSSLFKRINPEEVDNIDEYNTIATQLKEGFKPNQVVNLESAHKSLKDMVTKMYRNEFNVSPAEAHTPSDMLDQLELRKNENKTNDRIEQLANELGIDFDQAASIYNEEEKGGNPKQLRDNLLTIAKSLKVDTSEPQVGIKQNIVDLINKINPELLSVAQLKKFIAVVDRINENNSFSEAGTVYAMALAQEGWRNIKAAKAKFKVLNLNYLESKIDSLPLAIKAIFGLSEVASSFQLHSGMTDVSNVKDYASKAKNDLTQKLNELHHKQREKGFTDESVFRQAIYGNLIAYPEKMNSEEALAANKQIIEEMIQTYADAGLSKDATVVSNLYKPFKEANTIEEVQSIMKKIDPDGQRALHSIIDFFTDHKISDQDNRTILEALTDDNELFHNEDTENIVNYSGSRKWRPVGALNNKEVDVEDLDQFDSNNPAKPKRLSSGYSRAMKYQKGKVLDLNAHLNATNQVEHNVYDIVSKPYRLQVREFAHDKEALMELFGSPEFEGEVNREELSKKETKDLDKKEQNKKQAADIINKIFEGKNSLYHSFERTAMGQNTATRNTAEKVGLGILSAVKALGYGMTLSGFTQVVKQATVLINTGIQTGLRGSVVRSLVEITANPTEASKFFSGTTVNLRGESHALLNAGDSVDRTAVHNIKNKIKGLIPSYLQSRFDGKIGWVSGITPLIFSDVKSAKSSYLAFYEQYLNKNSDGYQGLEEENKRRNEKSRVEARAFAKTQVDTLQGVSNPAEQGEWFKDPHIISNFARAFFVPYGHFASNSKARLYADYAALLNGNSNQKVEAGKDILATAAESVGFAVTAQGARAAMLLTVGTLLSKTIGFPDKDDWDEWFEKAKKIAFKDMLFSNLPVILTAGGENATVDLLNWALYGLLNMEEEGISNQQFEKEYSPLNRIDTFNNKWYDYLGPYGAAVAGTARAFELQNKGFNEDLTDDQRKLALTAAFAQYGQLIGVAPADVTNAIKATFYNQMQQNKTAIPTRTFERSR